MSKLLNTYAFDLVTWKKDASSQTPNGTYFIKCDHFPSSKDIDNYIINNYNECKKAGKNESNIFSKSSFNDIVTLSTINNGWFVGESKIYFIIKDGDKNKTYFMEYLNIRKI